MSRKQFLIILAVLAVLGAAGAWITWSDRIEWQKVDMRVGQKMLPAFKAVDVAEILLRDGRGQVHLRKTGTEWTVQERADFPIDVNRLNEMLNKTSDLKIVQIEKLEAAQRAGFQLVDPAADKKADAAGAGTVIEMKDAAGKPMARMVLGKIVTKLVMEAPEPGQPPREFEKPVGRHLTAGNDAENMLVVSDALVHAEAKPDAWLAKEVLHIDRTKSITVIGPDGAERWTVTRTEEGQWWNFGEGGPRPDQQKSQDSVSPLYAVNIIDVVPDVAAVKSGLSAQDKPLTAIGRTFDNLTYTLKIGNKVEGAKPEDNRYYVTFSIAGDPPKERTPEKGEKPEDTEKKAKEYAEYRVKLLEQVAREKKYSKWTFLFPARPVEPLLRTRAEMMPDKKPVK